MNNEIEGKKPLMPDGDGVKPEDDWLDTTKACNLQDGECEACQ